MRQLKSTLKLGLGLFHPQLTCLNVLFRTYCHKRCSCSYYARLLNQMHLRLSYGVPVYKMLGSTWTTWNLSGTKCSTLRLEQSNAPTGTQCSNEVSILRVNKLVQCGFLKSWTKAMKMSWIILINQPHFTDLDSTHPLQTRGHKAPNSDRNSIWIDQHF